MKAGKSKQKRYRLKRVKLQIASGKKKTAKLKVPKRTRKVAAKALKHGGKVTVRFTVHASDAAGNSRTAHKTVKLR